MLVYFKVLIKSFWRKNGQLIALYLLVYYYLIIGMVVTGLSPIESKICIHGCGHFVVKFYDLFLHTTG